MGANHVGKKASYRSLLASRLTADINKYAIAINNKPKAAMYADVSRHTAVAPKTLIKADEISRPQGSITPKIVHTRQNAPKPFSFRIIRSPTTKKL